MTKDLLVMSETATIVEDPDTTTPMSVRLPTREDKILPKEEVEEKNHRQEREGVEMIIMNEEHPGEAMIRKGRTSQQGATQNEDIKLMLVNGYPAPTPTITPRYHSNSEYTQDEGVAGLAFVSSNSYDIFD